MKLYLDTVATIFLVEKVSPFDEIILEKISRTQAKIVVSEMNRLECRVKPLRKRDLALLKDFDDFFESEPYKIIPIGRKVIDKATTLRAAYNFKTPDSIHLAAAIFSRCKTFLTYDTALKKCSEIQVELLSDLMQTWKRLTNDYAWRKNEKLHHNILACLLSHHQRDNLQGRLHRLSPQRKSQPVRSKIHHR